MRKPRWAYLVMLVVGAGLGVAIAGVPSRGKDPPLRVQTESTTISPPPTTISPAPAPTTTSPPAPPTTDRPVTTTRRR